MIRENCREDEDYRLVEEDGKKGLDGNTRQQSKRCHMNKGETRMADRGALRVGKWCHMNKGETRMAHRGTLRVGKRCHMNKGGTHMAHRGALRVGDAVSVCPWFRLLSFWSSANH